MPSVRAGRSESVGSGSSRWPCRAEKRPHLDTINPELFPPIREDRRWTVHTVTPAVQEVEPPSAGHDQGCSADATHLAPEVPDLRPVATDHRRRTLPIEKTASPVLLGPIRVADRRTTEAMAHPVQPELAVSVRPQDCRSVRTMQEPVPSPNDHTAGVDLLRTPFGYRSGHDASSR